ncbi:SMI1 / KNR4 family (SUKH-1) [Tenacibaculum sp. MAR_2009_124]|uniref:SMI1/KNR4 family protein n=1 Tax=Tenacibaculum sp. MAR_2009_124 TaxID=1250059 RepID=UPI0008979A8D|nr:SMI1/KNR4 family protein [Tenacibaculum sp. MAR_2009_124]SEC37830.1 SMI1 / KNR4 family (SUKH-1) [Tenacibaculum sp. MAR_2009_124]
MKITNIKFEAKGENLTLEEVLEFERFYAIELPESYKSFMLENNGMRLLRAYFFKPEVWEEELYFEYLLPIKYGKYNLERANIGGLDDFPNGHLSIGHVQGGTISLSVKKDDYGSIHVYYSDGEMHKLTDSFTEFLEGLKEL